MATSASPPYAGCKRWHNGATCRPPSEGPIVTDLTVLSTDSTTDATWWRQAVVYQVYPRSFADSNGDGLGDLPGITSRIGYLAGIGVDAIWLSPFYPSALADGGYDVSDYREVHPQLGTLDDFDDLVAVAHAAGIKVIVDIVPNHTSNLHPWFEEALASPPGSPARERYIFRDGKGADGSRPPSDWISHFGGSAWTRIPDGQWYCHLFAPEQPDLNWDNREVRDDFLRTLRFWADRGVDGFRVDVAHALAKDLSEPLRSKPVLESHPSMPVDGTDPLYDRDEVHEIYREWREVFDSYDPPRTAVAEACAPSERRALYARPTELGQAFNFDLLEADYDASAFRDAITFCLDQAAQSGSSSTWVLSNHDVVRHASRYGLPIGTDLEEWLMSDGSSAPRRRGGRAAPSARRHGSDAGSARILLLLPGRGARAARGRGPTRAGVAGPDLDSGPRTRRRAVTAAGCRCPGTRSTVRTASAPPVRRGCHSRPVSRGPRWRRRRGPRAAPWSSTGRRCAFVGSCRPRRSSPGCESEDPEVLHFVRPGGWHCISNFGAVSVALPDGVVRLSSGVHHVAGVLPGETTVWFTEWTT